ncbi:MAG: beta-propeller domain-containing protein [Candidatus Bathyarchaeia archaeon]
MQKEIRKRASVYGAIAVLLATTLTILCYNFGVIPEFGETPQQFGFLKTFSSYEELRNYLVTNSRNQGFFPYYGPSDVRFLHHAIEGFPSSADALSLKLYSTTNIQVAGVDEADTVKTDGDFIYLASGTNIYVLKAYPPEEAQVLSTIFYNDTYPAGIFVNGNRLAVLTCKYTQYMFPSIFPPSGYGYYYIDIKTSVDIYDVSDREKPSFLTNFTISGSYFSSRMIGDYIYFVVSQPAYVIYDTVILPKIYSNNGFKEISPSEIHYANATDDYYQYTTIVSLNVQNITEPPNHETILLGGTSSMYVSLKNLYITFPEMDGLTSIYRIQIENNTINCEAYNKVLGHELNQFSMDEYNDYFRIATTTWINGTPQNNLYILDLNLSLIGRLEDFAPPGETMDSARFIANRCYLSTSTPRKDPFFVIDVENASEPKILGNLSIPGFTRYLHPYDENHVIGIGRDGSNVKLTLFDVSNVNAPINMSEFKVEGDWTDTLALTEHKAFLFDKSKELLVIPVSITDYYNGKWWQGVYIFNINLSNGLILRGNITHLEDSAIYWNVNYEVRRALFIEETLYTVSDRKVKMNSLDDLHFINEIELP